MWNRLLVSKCENVCCGEMAKGEFAHETFFSIVVAVADIILSFSIFVVAMFFGKLLFKMPERIKCLEQHRKQNCGAAKELDDGRMLFHRCKGNA